MYTGPVEKSHSNEPIGAKLAPHLREGIELAKKLPVGEEDFKKPDIVSPKRIWE